MYDFYMQFTGESIKYLVITAVDYDNFVNTLKSIAFRKEREKMQIGGFEFNGSLLTCESKLSAPCVYISEEISTSARHYKVLPTKKIDILANEYLKLEEKIKLKEKEIINYLKGKEGNAEVGSLFGAFHRYTISTRVSYKDLLEKIMNLVKRIYTLTINKDLKEVIDIYSRECRDIPHKSSLPSLHVFDVKDKDEQISKIWVHEN